MMMTFLNIKILLNNNLCRWVGLFIVVSTDILNQRWLTTATVSKTMMKQPSRPSRASVQQEHGPIEMAGVRKRIDQRYMR